MESVNATKWGILANSTVDNTLNFQRMFEECPSNTTFVLEPGTYHFYSENAIEWEYSLSNTEDIPKRKLALQLRNMDNVVLEGNGAKFIFHGQIMPITVDQSRTVVIKDLTIDWEIPLSAEGRVIHSTETFIDVKIDHERFPYVVEDQKLYFLNEGSKALVWDVSNTEFDYKLRKVAYRKGDTFPKTWQEDLKEGIIRFHGDFEDTPEIGNILVLRHNERLHAGVFITDSYHINLNHITIHHTGGLGILAQFSHDLAFQNIKIMPNHQRGRQIISSHDDGIHLSCNSGHIEVEHCYFYGLMDDPLNIHGIVTQINEKIDSYTVMGEFKHPQSRGFARWAVKGQEISLMNTTDMSEIGRRTVREFQLLSKDQFVLSFYEELPEELLIGDSMENLSWTASLTCKNNFFGNCRARGILVSTPKPVLIEDNVFESSGAAILIAGDANYWFESGRCNDVIIRNNHFGESCLTSSYMGGDAVISIHPEVLKPTKSKPFHHKIHIVHNCFQTSDIPILYAYCTEDLTFWDNKIIHSDVYQPWNERKNVITLEYCSKVSVKSNYFLGEVLDQSILISGMEFEDVIEFDAMALKKEG